MGEQKIMLVDVTWWVPNEVAIIESYFCTHTHTHTHTHSKVFLCKRKVDNSLIVIKQITVDELQKEDRKAAMNEIDILERLKHPNIIAYFDSFVDDKSLMIVMEYAPGGTLFDFIQDRNGTLLGEEVHTLREFV